MIFTMSRNNKSEAELNFKEFKLQDRDINVTHRKPLPTTASKTSTKSTDFVWFNEQLDHSRDYSSMFGFNDQNQVDPIRCSSPIGSCSPTDYNGSVDSSFRRDFEELRDRTMPEGCRGAAGGLSPVVARLKCGDSGQYHALPNTKDCFVWFNDKLEHSRDYSSMFDSDDRIPTAPERCKNSLGFTLPDEDNPDFNFLNDFERQLDQNESKIYEGLTGLAAAYGPFVPRPSFFSSPESSDTSDEKETPRQPNVYFFKAGKLFHSLRSEMPGVQPWKYMKLPLSPLSTNLKTKKVKVYIKKSLSKTYHCKYL